MRVTLVRHGETTGQSSIRYYGATDVPLSDTGREQMRRVHDALQGHSFDTVLTSRLRRSIEAAEIITGGRTVLTPMEAFDEVHFGRWEGWTRAEIELRDPENFRLWQEKRESFLYPEGESRAGFYARVAAGLAAALQQGLGDSVLMVLHRGVISVILTELLALSHDQRHRIDIDLASIHVIRHNGNAWEAQVLDQLDHLQDRGARRA